MQYDKELSASVQYDEWIAKARNGFNEALHTLEWDQLCSTAINPTAWVRSLYCAVQLKDKKILSELLFASSDQFKNNFFYAACNIFLAVANDESDSKISEIVEYVLFNVPEKSLNSIIQQLGKIDTKVWLTNEQVHRLCKIQFFIQLKILILRFTHNDKLSHSNNTFCYKLLAIYFNDDNVKYLLNELNTNIKQIFDISSLAYPNNKQIAIENIIQNVRNENYFTAYQSIKILSTSEISNNAELSCAYVHTCHKLGLYDEGFEYLKENCERSNLTVNERYEFLELLANAEYYETIPETDVKSFSYIIASKLYKYKYRASATDLGKKRLYIFVSHDDSLIGLKTRLNGNILHVADTQLNWYLICPELLIYLIKTYISSSDIDVIIMGGSRGGFGSILLGYLLHLACDNIITVIPFSPQIQIYPFNINVFRISAHYGMVMNILPRYYFFRKSAKRFGNHNRLLLDNLSTPPHHNRLFINIYVGGKHVYDMYEVRKLNAYNTVKVSVMPDFASHFSMTYFYFPLEYLGQKAIMARTLKYDSNEWNILYNYKIKYNYDMTDVINAALERRDLF